MTGKSRLAVAERLAEIGLLQVLLLSTRDGQAKVSRLRRRDNELTLVGMGEFAYGELPLIGRVGIPDPQLGIAFEHVMPFYGKWFDDIGETDAGYHIRRNISQLTRERLVEQIKRDEQYAVVGPHTAIFEIILDIKQRVPMVLVDDRYLSLTSFPVALPVIDDAGLAAKLRGVLHVMLKASSATGAGGPDDIGIEVDES